MSKKSNDDIKKMSFEAAMQELDRIVNQLESGQAELEDSIDFYTRGDLLRKHCEQKLKDAKLKVEKITEAS